MQPLRRVSQMRQKVFGESHRSKQHQRKLETKSKSQSKQTFLQIDQVNFKEQVVSSFLAADIPLHKLNHPSLKSLFATMGKVLPSETAARACVAKLASQKEEQIQELLRDKTIFLIVDQAEIAKQKYSMCLWAAWMPQIRHYSFITIHLTAVAMLIAVLFCTLWMTYCDNLK